MRMDRNINKSGKGKYAIVNMRKIKGDPRTPQALAKAILANPECVDFGCTHTEQEFFLIRLKDRHAQPALLAYAKSIKRTDPEFSLEVLELATRSGPGSRFCKEPD